MSASTIVKTSMNLPQESLDTLRELAVQTGTSMTEVVRRAVATEKFLRDTSAEGSKILIKDKGSDTMRELLIR